MPQSLSNYHALHVHDPDVEPIIDPNSGGFWSKVRRQVERLVPQSPPSHLTRFADELPSEPRLSDASFVLSGKGEVLDCSLASARYLGITHHEVMGAGLLSWIHVQDRPVFLTKMSDIAHDGARLEFDLRVRRHTKINGAGGQAFTHVRARALPLLATGSTADQVRIRLVFWDNQAQAATSAEKEMVQLELAQQQLRLSQARAGFANHMQALRQMVDVIGRQDNAANRQKQCAQMVDYLARAEKNLVEFNAIEDGQYQAVPRATRLQLLIDEGMILSEDAQANSQLSVMMDMQLLRWMRQALCRDVSAPLKFSVKSGFVCLDFDAGQIETQNKSAISSVFLKAEQFAQGAGGRLVMHKMGDKTGFYRLHLPIRGQNSAQEPAQTPHKSGEAHSVTQWIGNPIGHKQAAG